VVRPRRRRPLSLSRIFARARPDGDCLLLPTRHGGYAYVRVDGRSDRAHRLAWRLYHRRRIPPDRLVTHSCDSPPCIARAHLRLGTYQSNAREAAERGRMRRGESNPAARLTAVQVLEVRARCADRATRQADVAADLNVSTSTIASIVQGRTWRHLLAAAV
jgi:hypothetical protein